ncbi:MAG: serine/threonine-protein kinase [Gemmatimonadota bacterium]
MRRFVFADATTGLPSDLALDTARRVSIAGLGMGSIWAMFGLYRLIFGPDPRFQTAWDQFGDPMTVLEIALALVVAWAARRFRNHLHLVLGLGLGHEVVVCAGAAALTQWNPPLLGRGISWVCVAILAYPAIVPARPRTVFMVALIAAAMDPLFYLLAMNAGVTTLRPASELGWMFVPQFICAALAVIPARIVRQLGHAVREARDLGSYRLGERLGVGGMGEVYRASHRLLARPAAVKLIAPAFLRIVDGPAKLTVLERFRREASAAANLRSPHTIDLYDFGIAEDGSLYYAMELLDGIDLQELVETHGIQPPGRVIHLLSQACLSLAEAHEQGLVHRDIKPSNLMLCRMGTQVDFLKVLDFGLVKVETDGDAALTAPNVSAGTPAYMAPEAVDGVHDVDLQADLYALGCVAYWLLTGRPVFEGKSSMAVLIKHLSEAPAPMASTGAVVPHDLERVVFGCLEKAPAHRPASAQALDEALRSCVDAGGWTTKDADTWWNAHGPPTLAGAPGKRRPPSPSSEDRTDTDPQIRQTQSVDGEQR